ncbi:hypothetical protein JCM10213_007405 [Rhodosporidiobolus nylandii]
MTVRKRVSAFIRKHFIASSSSPPPPSTSSPSASSPSISRRSTGHGAALGVDVPQVRSHHPPSGNTVADRPVTQPRATRRRRRRRTQSPVGLPLYSKDPGEEEMMLFRSEVDLTMAAHDVHEGEEEEAEEDGEESSEEGEEEEEENGRSRSRSREPSLARPSVDVSTDAGHSYRSSIYAGQQTLSPLPSPPALPAAAAEFAGNRPRSASAPLAHLSPSSSPSLHPLSRFVSHSPGSTSPFASRSGLIDLPVNESAGGPDSPSRPSTPSSPRGNPPVALRSTWGAGHRSTRSSPINALSPPSPSGSPSPLGIGRPRSSTLQRMLASRNASQASLGGSIGEGAGRSPYGQLGGAAAGSRASLAESLRERDISGPLPNSFVHSSFVFPRSGPTPQQVAFISSRDSIGAYGYGAGVAEPPFASPPTFHAATSSVSLALPGAVPERPSAGVQGRGRSASSASRTSATSPLARVETLTPPPSPLRRAAPLSMPVPDYSADAPPAEPEEPKTPPLPSFSPQAARRPPPASPSPAPSPPVAFILDSGGAPTVANPSPSTAPTLSLNLSHIPSLPRFSGSATPSPATPSALLARRPSAAGSPPPQIVTLAPTPTGSAAPSPLLPSSDAASEFPPAPPPATEEVDASYFSLPATSAASAAEEAPLPESPHGRDRRSRELNISTATTVSEASFVTEGSWATARLGPVSPPLRSAALNEEGTVEATKVEA